MTREAAHLHAEQLAMDSTVWAELIRAELENNILPFWRDQTVDRARGGFFGEISSEGVLQAEAPRSSVVNTRILWTYATAARVLGDKWAPLADWAYDYVTTHFVDRDHGGLYWLLDAKGQPLSDRKQTYAQAFGIYALSEYVRLTGSQPALELAQKLYGLIEAHCYDAHEDGYIEARDRTWQPLEDMRLSDKDLNSPKSMNTHLHVLEGYTNLLRVWPDEGLKAKQRALINVMLDRIVDGDTGHFKLFFDTSWHSLNEHVSFGHDIEGSWLLMEAAEVLGEKDLIAKAHTLCLKMARACLAEGLDADGSMFFEANTKGELLDETKHWWVQAEAVVGFYNAFEMTGEEDFRRASLKIWDYIETHVVDRVHGEWHAKLKRDGTAFTGAEDGDAVLVGPWKCPYHNGRVCTEMLERLARRENETP